jgi:hypothetical protein
MSDTETLSTTKNSKASTKKAIKIAKETGEKPSKKNSRDDLGVMCTDFFSRINFKIAIFLFVFGIFLFSDLFIENVLCKIKDATSADSATTKGTCIQLIILVIFYLIVDLLVGGEII